MLCSIRLVLSSAFLFITISADAQIKKSKTWDICLHGGLIIPNTDLSNNYPSQIGFGYSVTKFVLPFFALQEQLLIGKLKGNEAGTGSNSKYNFETKIDYSASIHALFQIGNVSFLRGIPNLAVYGSAGIGIIRFSPSVFRDDSTTARNYYVQNNLVDNSVDYTKTSELTFPLAVGIKYRMTKRFSLHLEYSLRLTNTDKLDGWYRLQTSNDKFSYLNAGLTLHIGNVSQNNDPD